MKTPKPSAAYKKAQQELTDLEKSSSASQRKSELREQLQAEFMSAWKLLPDQRRQAKKIESNLVRGGMAGEFGFEHCSYFYSLDQAGAVIVAHPHGKCGDELRRIVTLGSWCSPEIIHAPEWAFHCPGKAELYVVLFPYGYGKAIAALARACGR